MIGERLRAMRQARGLTQDDLAQRLGVPILKINRWENEKYKPDSDDLRRLCNELEVSADFLLGITDEPYAVAESDLQPKERAFVHAWRRGHLIEALRLLVSGHP